MNVQLAFNEVFTSQHMTGRCGQICNRAWLIHGGVNVLLPAYKVISQ